MNKSQLIDAIAAKTGQSKTTVAAVINEFTNTVQATLAQEGDVALPGFGTFKTGERAAQSRYSALAGRVVNTSARTVPVFRPSAALKAAVDSKAAAKAA